MLSTDIEDPPEQATASLVSGILVDLQHLIEQQALLMRREVEEELRQRATAAVVLALGLAILFLDAAMLCLTLVHLLHWAFSSAGTDPAWLPLFACHAVATAMLGIIGGIVAHAGRAKFKSINPCPNPTTEIFQEHESWTTRPN